MQPGAERHWMQGELGMMVGLHLPSQAGRRQTEGAEDPGVSAGLAKEVPVLRIVS